MELTDEFTVGLPIDEAWALLTDLERIAPCMPGAELQEVEGDEYRGVVKVKVGPITASYKGVASFVERDAEGRRAVIRAEGRDTRGQGNAAATITATLAPADADTQVTLHTDLSITGKVAQFGRGVLADVSRKLLKQFVQCLETEALTATPTAPTSPETEPTPTPPEPTTGGARPVASVPAEPIDLLAATRATVVKRLVPVVFVLGAVAWLVWRR